MDTTLKTSLRWLAFVIALFASAASFAQAPNDRGPLRYSEAELDQMLAPIALYPDSLLSQLLMAATFPRDIAEAAAWSRANPGLRGDEAVRAVDNEPWDPSVKSLVAFPQVLAMMDERMDWTERLGEAFMTGPDAVSDTIQVLRRRADQAGNLRSGEEIVVRRDYDSYVIEPAEPEVVYVPYYDPRVVYGRWWWPDYEPVWWSPWVGYDWTPGYTGFGWGYGISLGSGFFYSSFDWPRRYIRFYGNRPYYYHGHSRYHGHRWWSDRDHRRNIRGWDGYRRDRDGRRDGRWDGRRDGRWDGRRDGRDGRDGRWDGRRDGRDGRRTDRAPGPKVGVDSSGVAPGSSYAAPLTSGSASAEPRRAPARGLPTAPLERSYDRGQPAERRYERQYAPPPAAAGTSSMRPIERQAPAASSMRPIERQAPAMRPVERQAPAMRPVERQAPAASSMRPVERRAPVVREAPAPAARESRPQRSEPRQERSEPSRAEPLSDGGGRSGGGGPKTFNR